MRKLGVYLILHLVCFSILAQGKNAFDLIKGDRIIGNEYFDRMDYRNAIVHYQKTLNKHPEDTEVKFKIAQSYLKLNEPINSEVWLRSLASYSDASKDMLFLYAEVLMRNGKFDQAKTWYENILQKNWDAETASKLNFINKINAYKNVSKYKIDNLEINSELADFAVYPISDGMIFLSSRQVHKYIQYQPANASREDEGMIRFFIKNKSEISPLVYSEEVKPFYHDGPFSFYEDEKMVAFTRNELNAKSKDKGFINLKIFFADCSDLAAWKNIIPFQHNNKKYSVGHPALSNDGKILIFSSDMPGGNGKTDLYISYREEDSWTEPVNLGSKVNTSGTELFPYLHNDTTLYFASTGLGGFGGLDIFKAKLNGFEAKEPINLGQPINSFSDDFSFYLNEDGNSGYFASNREGGKGLDDIYAFKSTSTSLVVQLVTQSSDQRLRDIKIGISALTVDYHQSTKSNESGYLQFEVPVDNDFQLSVEHNFYYVSDSILYSNKNSDSANDTLLIKLEKRQLIAHGNVVDKDTIPISNALVILENPNKGKIDSLKTNSEGTYSFQIDPESNFILTASSDGYYTRQIDFNTADTYSGSIVNDIVLEDSIVNPKIYDLFVTGRLYSNESHELLPGALVLLDNISTSTRDSVRTTSEGTYSFRLTPDKQYKITALEDGFIPNGFSINTHDLYVGMLLNDILLEEEYEDKLIVFFDFNSRELNNSYEKSLQNMLKILSENPNSTLKITAHADTRGSADYNKQLSIDRLNSVKQYFVKRGISESRLEGISFGEELPLNQCSSGVECEEEDHSQNRRAELKVQIH